MNKEDKLGDRLKSDEQAEAGRKCDATLPLMCRLDGKAFHTFTKGLKRPYDLRLSRLMIDTTKYLVEKTNAELGYTQSDEISLYWFNDQTETRQYWYDGKYQKLCSVMAGMASAYFAKELGKRIPEKADAIPVFDARVWNVVPKDVYLNFLWRQNDAIKNSISMAAQAHFSSKQLHGVCSEEKKRMLQEIGKPWHLEPLHFKSGTFVKRQHVISRLSREQLSKIPEKHRPDHAPIIKRSVISELDIGYLPDCSALRLTSMFPIPFLSI
jgi:tRNA(His) 5'-end guanylyltransferase